MLPSAGGVLGGHGFRSEPRALDQVDAILGAQAIRLELVDPRFYHLDTCLCPLGEEAALWYPPAFSAGSQDALRRSFPRLIAVPEAEALRFACNALPVDDALVLNTGCPETVAAAGTLGYRCVETPTSEFIKAGGSVKCLVLTLDSFS